MTTTMEDLLMIEYLEKRVAVLRNQIEIHHITVANVSANIEFNDAELRALERMPLAASLSERRSAILDRMAFRESVMDATMRNILCKSREIDIIVREIGRLREELQHGECRASKV